jgi:hypothetical protein
MIVGSNGSRKQKHRPLKESQMAYNPNFRDPRVQRRTQNALAWSISVFSSDKSRAYSTRQIDRYFGQAQHALSEWLRKQLLIETDSHWNKDTGQCKKYQLNSTGVDFISEILCDKMISTRSDISSADADSCHVDSVNNNNYTILPYCITSQEPRVDIRKTYNYQLVKTLYQREYGEELHSFSFDYLDKSHRLWHPIQNIRSEYRKPFLADNGLRHEYDLVTAAPTLIYQQAQHMGMIDQCAEIQLLLEDRTAYRQRVADLAEVPLRTAKVLITALFCGARLGHNPDFALSHLLAGDRARIEVLKQDPGIQRLKQEIKQCWDHVRKQIPPRYNAQTGRRIAVSSKEKWSVYFDMERRVLDSIARYLELTDNACFLEHDGWTCCEPVDDQELCAYVRLRTGFVIGIEHRHND